MLEKLHTKLAPAFKNHYVKPKTAGTIFGVKHYAGLVNYDTSGFLDKNKDSLFDELAMMCKQSQIPFITSLFEDFVENDQKKKTVGAQFKVWMCLQSSNVTLGSIDIFVDNTEYHRASLRSMCEAKSAESG
jgi:myosin heavy subunit